MRAQMPWHASRAAFCARRHRLCPHTSLWAPSLPLANGHRCEHLQPCVTASRARCAAVQTPALHCTAGVSALWRRELGHSPLFLCHHDAFSWLPVSTPWNAVFRLHLIICPHPSHLPTRRSWARWPGGAAWRCLALPTVAAPAIAPLDATPPSSDLCLGRAAPAGDVHMYAGCRVQGLRHQHPDLIKILSSLYPGFRSRKSARALAAQ